eukprot:12018379-Ditylum_brightwellii.AAC.1
MPIVFSSRKLNSAQLNYTTGRKELLTIIETFKKNGNILYGLEMVLYTHHQNFTYKNFNTERVIRWEMVIEDFGPKLVYIKGGSIAVADAMSRLESKELNWFEEGTRGLHVIAKGLADLKKQTNRQLSKKAPDLRGGR